MERDKTIAELQELEYKALEELGKERQRIAELEAREIGYIQSLRELEAENQRLRDGIIKIAEQGCEGSFQDENDICLTALDYVADYYCSPCMAAELLEGE